MIFPIYSYFLTVMNNNNFLGGNLGILAGKLVFPQIP